MVERGASGLGGFPAGPDEVHHMLELESLVVHEISLPYSLVKADFRGSCLPSTAELEFPPTATAARGVKLELPCHLLLRTQVATDWSQSQHLRDLFLSRRNVVYSSA